MSEDILNSYSYKLNKLILYTSGGDVINVRKMFLELNLYEDLFSPCMTGTLTLADAQDLLSNFRFHGNEFLELELDKPSMDAPIKKIFRIYKIANKSADINLQNYTMYLASEEMIISPQSLISKSYKGLTIKQMIEDILKNYLKVMDSKISTMSETSGNYDIIIPKMNALEAIQWLATRAYSDKSSLYMFFENRDGFNFVSYEDLLKVPTYGSYSRIVKTNDDPAKNMQTFTSLNFIEEFDLLKATRYGSFSSSINTLDIITKSFDTFNFNSIQFKNKGILNKEVPMSGFLNRNKKSFFDTYENMQKFVMVTDSDPTNNPTSPENWLAQTASKLGQLHLYKMVGTVPGDPMLKAGMTIDIEIQNFLPQEDGTSALNKVRSGKYLISAVHHKVAGDIHVTVLELLSDSIGDFMAPGLNNSEKIQEIIKS